MPGPRRPVRVAAALVAATALLAGCGGAAEAPAPAAAGLENCGVDVPLRTPTKIFAAFQNGIEAVYALGAGDRVVGAAYLDNVPIPEVTAQFRPEQQRPVYFPEEYPSREEVLRLAPDLVVSGFTGAFTREGLGTRAELARAGTGTYLFRQYCPSSDGAGQTSLAVNDVSFDGVYADLTDLGRLLGAPDRAQALVDRMRTSIDGTRARLDGVTTRPRVAMINRPGGAGELRVFGTGDMATTLIEAAGGVQAFPELDGRQRRISLEGLVTARPDVIVVPACCGADIGPEGARELIDELRANPALAQVPAVRDGRVYPSTFAEVTPGVRNADALENLARQLHPERF
ncbi:iron complex transport system substrate-binding protein [Pseudonocardia sediminis]|uniref:Iron complex transport system substrate-binding protein n=1 Tax=Pseudonocardia sediminis TaxID=1397368 RepID=A0A4Q7UUB6_PSEST|nr:ABC transporter substrate-binding protein [Pseudonocardia sediminis]RZT85335.1 iron complex transport system substrate-binding protein [Pseudonocardia sediminis]